MSLSKIVILIKIKLVIKKVLFLLLFSSFTAIIISEECTGNYCELGRGGRLVQEITSHRKGFINILDLKKWESNRVEEFGVTSSPTYFVLDRNKIILAKPNDVYELKKIFKLR